MCRSLGSKSLTELELKLELREIQKNLEMVRDQFDILINLKKEYNERCFESDQRLQRLIDEKYGELPDIELEQRTRFEQKTELERRLWVVREQQMSLADACVAAYGTSTFERDYRKASRSLEEKLQYQMEVLGVRNFRKFQAALKELKEDEINQERYSGAKLEDLYTNLSVQAREKRSIIERLEAQKEKTERKVKLMKKEKFEK